MVDAIKEAGARIAACYKAQNEELDLSGLGLEELPSSICKLGRLKKLYINGNDIGDSGAEIIAGSLRNLTELHINNNNLSDAIARIIAARLRNLNVLHIAGNRLGDAGVKAIAKIENLTELHLENNCLNRLDADAFANKLTKLTTLNISGNSIGYNGAKSIAEHLTGLTHLYIDRADIGDRGADAIARHLTRLIDLKIEDNEIGDRGAIAIAEGLANLKILKASNNNIGDEGAKAIALRLAKLTTLKIENNEIGNASAKALLRAFYKRKDEADILTLTGNNITFPSREVLSGSDAKSLVAAYHRYKEAESARQLEPLNEAKIFIVGDQAVGKTSLVRFLVTNLPRQNETRTGGIEKTHWKSPGGTKITADILDFADQEVIYSAHHYFFTERSLYLLVLSDRKFHDRSIYRWLPSIEARAGNAPVIVVVNQCDRGERHLMLQWDEIRSAYNRQVVNLIHTSCNDDDWARDSIAELRKLISQTFKSNALKKVGDCFPSNWLRIKNRLDWAVREHHVITYEKFVAECERKAIETEFPGPVVDDPAEQRQLLRTLHNLGVVIVPEISKASVPNPDISQIIDPYWLSKGIYRILQSQKLLAQNGVLNKKNLVEWLDREEYPEQYHDTVLRLMEDESIGLAVSLNLPDHYLVPKALPAGDIKCEHVFADGFLSFAYQYDPLPDSLLPRFIAKAFVYSKDAQMRTRYNVLLHIQGCPVHVAVNIRRNLLTIRVGGAKNKRSKVLAHVRDLLAQVHLILGLQAKALVPLSDEPDKFVPYDHLLDLKANDNKNRANDEFLPQCAKRYYKWNELLQGIADEPPLEAQWKKNERHKRQQSQNRHSDPPATTGHTGWRQLIHRVLNFNFNFMTGVLLGASAAVIAILGYMITSRIIL